MKNPKTGDVKYAPVGFSWTSFFFGPFVPFLRGHVKWGILSIIPTIILGPIGTALLATSYNEIYAKWLMSKGYEISTAANII